MPTSSMEIPLADSGTGITQAKRRLKLEEIPIGCPLDSRPDQAQAREEQVAVLLLDLDGSKRVNGTLGHVAGHVPI
jgi:GGDEF domain-containing protein